VGKTLSISTSASWSHVALLTLYLHRIMFCLPDFEEHAKKTLSKNAWDYYTSGANQEQTLRDNVEAFSRY